mmetsp:Transcript_23731/g.55336  ORF Transcript_23731/g.55336 Transcript_23731/m.55336 type:complete len:670 (+) Transcript_23731:114-2123(+)
MHLGFPSSQTHLEVVVPNSGRMERSLRAAEDHGASCVMFGVLSDPDKANDMCLGEQFARLEERMSQHIKETFKKARDHWEQVELALEGRVDRVEQELLAHGWKGHEAHIQARLHGLQRGLNQRLDLVDEVLGKASTEQGLLQETFRRSRERWEKLGIALEGRVEKIEKLQIKEKAEREAAFLQACQRHGEQVAVQADHGISCEGLAQELAAVVVSVHGLLKDLQAEQATRERQQAELQASFDEALQEHHASVRECINGLERLFEGFVKEHADARVVAKDELSQLDQRLEQRMEQVREQVCAHQEWLVVMKEQLRMEKQSWSQHSVPFKDQLTAERDARERSIAALQALVQRGREDQLRTEKQLRDWQREASKEFAVAERDLQERRNHVLNEEAHDRLVRELVAVEREARERSYVSLQDFIQRETKALKEHVSRERDERQASHMALKDAVQRESAVRETQAESHQEELSHERTLREQHEKALFDVIAAKQLSHEDFMDQQSQECSVQQRLESLERRASFFDGLVRAERAERSAETRHLWDKLDLLATDLRKEKALDTCKLSFDKDIGSAPVVTARPAPTPPLVAAFVQQRGCSTPRPHPCVTPPPVIQRPSSATALALPASGRARTAVSPPRKLLAPTPVKPTPVVPLYGISTPTANVTADPPWWVSGWP